jgi:hypothetical protein
MGRVVEGRFLIDRDKIISVLRATNSSVEDLVRFARMVRDAQSEKIDSVQFSERVKQDAPSFEPVLELLSATLEDRRHGKKGWKSAEWLAFLGLLFQILQTYIAYFPAAPAPPPAQASTHATPATPHAAPHRRTSRKIGRNEPCPCGSGAKFKKCCGNRPDSR